MSWPAASISKRSGRSAKAGSLQIWSHRLLAGVSIVIATPGRYARNGKRHKKQSASKKAAVVCAWVPGRRCGDVGRVCDRVAG